MAAQLVRHYPQGPHFAHSVGYVGRINEQEVKQLDPVNYAGTHHIGKTGIEKFYEDELHGQVGYEEVETNARGRVLRVLKRTDPIPGKDITLSLDLDLQEAAEEALGGRRGAIVALLPDTGEVVAMVSQPSFNPNLFVTGISFGLWRAARLHRPAAVQPRAARAVSAGLDHQADDGRGRPRCRGDHAHQPGLRPGLLPAAQRAAQVPQLESQRRRLGRSRPGHCPFNDTYFYDMAHKLGVDRMYDYMTRFGLGQRVSLDMYENRRADAVA